MIVVEKHHGDRAELLPLFRMADESENEILGYYWLGDALVALDNSKEVLGVALVEMAGGTVRIINIAVKPQRRGEGIGCRLVAEAVNYCRSNRARRLTVCTGAWESKNKAFYAKRGFRLFHFEKGFFTPDNGYAEVGDRVTFEMKI